jgi:small subunit ribosomal protein S6
MNITAPPAAMAEMERQMAINEDVVRFLTLRVDELDEDPSAMVRPARGRDDKRDDRRDERGGDRPERRDRDDRGREDRPKREGRPPRARSDADAEEVQS